MTWTSGRWSWTGGADRMTLRPPAWGRMYRVRLMVMLWMSGPSSWSGTGRMP
jgi:hypothetical protein